MCNTETQKFIDQVVAEKLQSDTMFTLFDVTLEVKEHEKSAGLPVSRHRDIHDDVLSAASKVFSEGWSRTLRPMSTNANAFVYFNPIQHDPANYMPRPRSDGGNNTPDGVNSNAVVDSSAAPTPPTPVKQIKPEGRTLDNWGRLRITADLLHGAEFQPGDIAHVFADGGGLSLRKYPDPSMQSVAHYLVSDRMNLRLTHRTLSKANLNGRSYYSITVSPGCLTVK